MSRLPRGTVTFLFTDIEGSTQLLTRLGDGYADVLARHRRVLRDAFAAHGGIEFGTAGDGFFVAFDRARDAIGAAVHGQRALTEDGPDVRVRMGIHTGEGIVRDGDYVGLDVHRAARICSAAHGGQVLVSRATRELVADVLPADVALRDLGEHRLKGLDRPDRLSQVAAAGLPAEFGPVRAGVPPGRASGAAVLPRPLNRTIGREHEVRAIAERIRAGDVRLLTLTGPGGVGKTRLAIEAARALEPEFADGAHFVALAALREPEDVPPAIVRALGIVPLAGEPAPASVTRYLSTKRALLVLDNFEHLLPTAAFVAELLSACPALVLLATSREPLGLAGEERRPVAPLAVPHRATEPHAVGRVPAVELFAERARALDPDFRLHPDTTPAVVEICRRVDGLPLAIELAAARCTVLSPAEIAARLDTALAVLGSGPRDAPPRHQTLRATIDWSHGLLADDDQAVFARFAVFAGGATIDAAETVTGAGLDTLDGLVTRSLLVRREQAWDGSTRLAMLETIRAYAGERFAAAADRNEVRERHCEYFLAFAERHGTAHALCGKDRAQHLARLDAELDNLHAALRWALDRRDPERALALVAALGLYWHARGRQKEARGFMDEVLGLAGSAARADLRIRILNAMRWVLRWVEPDRARHVPVMAEAEALARELGDPVLLAQTLETRARHEADEQRLDVCEALTDEAIRCAAEAGDGWQIAEASAVRAMAATTPAQLRERVASAAVLLTDAGNVYELASLYASAAYAAILKHSDLDGREYADKAIVLGRELGDPYLTMIVCGNLGLSALLTGDAMSAAPAFREELLLCRELVSRTVAPEGLLGLAGVAVVQGDLDRAARLVGAAAANPGEEQEHVEQRLETEFFAAARVRRGPAAWDAAVREGATLGFEDAIAFALEEPSLEG